MHLDGWTLLMQVVNFLVLGLLLWRFLYRPVQAAIDRRQATEAAARAEVAAARAEVERRQAEVDARLAAADAEAARRLQAAAEQAARAALAAQRQADDEIARSRARMQEDLASERRAIRAALGHEAGEVAVSFARRVLRPLAGPEMHHAMLVRLVQGVQELPPDQARAAGAALAAGDQPTLATTREPTLEDWQLLIQALNRALGTSLQALRIELDPSLLCGAELRLPGLTLAHHWTSQLQRLLGEIGDD